MAEIDHFLENPISTQQNTLFKLLKTAKKKTNQIGLNDELGDFCHLSSFLIFMVSMSTNK